MNTGPAHPDDLGWIDTWITHMLGGPTPEAWNAPRLADQGDWATAGPCPGGNDQLACDPTAREPGQPGYIDPAALDDTGDRR